MIIGAVAIFIVAFILQGVAQLYVELKYGQDTLNTLSKQLDQTEMSEEAVHQSEKEEWYVYHGARMASLLSDNPVLARPERLQRFCDILSIDFIMLFDEKGNETLCNKDYSGFTLNKGVGADASDFQRLLLGVPSVVHNVSRDATTELERQYIGVTLPLFNGKHGALIMALMPEQVQGTSNPREINKILADMTLDSTECFIADESDGEVLYSSDRALIGVKITEWGLSEKSLRDGYMDFGMIGDKKYFVLTDRQEDKICYYVVKTQKMFDSVPAFSGIAAAMFVGGAVILLWLFFMQYREKDYAKWLMVADSPRDVGYRSYDDASDLESEDVIPEAIGEAKPQKDLTLEERLENRVQDSKKKGLLHRLQKRFQWDAKQPEDKASIVFHNCLILLLIVWANLMFSKTLSGNGFDSMAEYLLHGDWVKGVNLFACVGLGGRRSITKLIDMLSEVAFRLISNLLMGKGKTITKLLRSAVRYMTMLVSIYLMLTYFGFPIGTVVGSIGIVSLALSLGARDLAADILAGLSIVFEKNFQVGDIVQIGDKKGMVKEIGVRSTRLETIDDNIVVIGNHSISSVVNLTGKLSWYSLEIKVPMDTPLEEVEAVLNRNLPDIGKRCDKIVDHHVLPVPCRANVGLHAVGAHPCRQIRCFQRIFRRISRSGAMHENHLHAVASTCGIQAFYMFIPACCNINLSLFTSSLNTSARIPM